MGISRQKLEIQKHLKRLNKPAVKTIQFAESFQGRILQTLQIPPLKSGEKIVDYADINSSPKREDEMESAPQNHR
ncbi:hypothetical protein FRX31_027163 [Thalictrum thalictroides]|uniref:Uncharacterized protein n=1 Tax=Thalictrum thalictroides TaxID=46969 RepID=A0A7J6VDT1_THATH|nr:hypothetical protein FRX31_027163 [Thalictrum thalictroides]